MENQTLKKGDLVVTSRGRYGIILDISNDELDSKCIVKIGNKNHTIRRSQLRKSSDVITFKVIYNTFYLGKLCTNSVEVVLNKSRTLYNKEKDINFYDVIEEQLKKQISDKVEILEVLIS